FPKAGNLDSLSAVFLQRQSQRTAKLTAKVPKIRSFSKIVVHNFYGVINSRFEEFRGRKY
ncbi:hypothetical protein DWW71_13635, partial [Ruminococcus sp. AF16-50]